MKKFFKIIGLLLVLLLGVGVLALLALYLFMTPAKMKVMIGNQLSEKLHRTVLVKGNVLWTVFPSLGLTLKEVQIGNPKGFVDTSLITINSLHVAIKMMPLLHKVIAPTGLEISGAKLYLVKKGREVNWTFAQKGKKKIGRASMSPSSVQPSHSLATLNLMHLPSVRIHDVDIKYINLLTKEKISIRDFFLYAKDIRIGKAFHVTLGARYASHHEPPFFSKLNLSTDVIINPMATEINCQSIQWKVVVGENVKGAHIDTLTGTGKVNILRGKKTLSLAASGQAKQEPIDEISRILIGRKRLSGLADITWSLHSKGMEAQDFLRSLKGTVTFAMQGGALHINDFLSKLRETMTSLKRPIPRVLQPGSKTLFNHFSMQASFLNGVASLSGIKLMAPEFLINGSGTIHLLSKATDISLGLHFDNPHILNGLTLPIRLQGDFPHLMPRVEIDSLVRQLIEKKGETFIRDKIEKVKKELNFKKLLNF
jgi:AsmA protein